MTPEMHSMKDYIEQKLVRPGVLVEEDTPLVSSGLIDSLALTEVILKLGDILALTIPASKVRPEDLDTLSRMFATAHKVGKPRPAR